MNGQSLEATTIVMMDEDEDVDEDEDEDEGMFLVYKKIIFIGMLDSKGYNFEASGETLRAFKENNEML